MNCAVAAKYNGEIGGGWRISDVPVLNPQSGAFQHLQISLLRSRSENGEGSHSGKDDITQRKLAQISGFSLASAWLLRFPSVLRVQTAFPVK